MRRLLIAVTLVLAIPTLGVATPVIDGSRLAAEFVPGGLTIAPASSAESRSSQRIVEHFGLTAADVARLFANSGDDATSSERIFLIEPSVRTEAVIPPLPDAVPWSGGDLVPHSLSGSINAAATFADRSTGLGSSGSGGAPSFGRGGASGFGGGGRGLAAGPAAVGRAGSGSNSGGNVARSGGTDGKSGSVPPSLGAPDKPAGNSNSSNAGSTASTGTAAGATGASTASTSTSAGVSTSTSAGALGAVGKGGALTGNLLGAGGPAGSGGVGTTTQVAQVPTPSVLWLIGSGLCGLAMFRRFRGTK